MKKIRKSFGTSVLKGNVVDSLDSNNPDSAPSIRAINEKIDGTVLYESTEGIAEGSFQINKDGYSKLRFYDTGHQFLGEITTDATVANLGLVYQGSSNLYLYGCRLFIEGNTFTIYSNKRNIFNGSSWSVDTSIDTIAHIGKVIGYK